MLPYYLEQLINAEACEDKNRKTQLINMWILRMPNDEERVTLQEKYYKLILPMINALKKDATIEVKQVPYTNPAIEKLRSIDYHSYEGKIENFNENTGKALQALREEIFRPKAIKDYIHIEQFFSAIVEATRKHKLSDAQNQAFTIWVFGLAQSLLDHELAMNFCYSKEDMVESRKYIHSINFALRPFYRAHRDASGLGTSFACEMQYKAPRMAGGKKITSIIPYGIMRDVEKILEEKTARCEELTQQVRPYHATSTIILAINSLFTP